MKGANYPFHQVCDHTAAMDYEDFDQFLRRCAEIVDHTLESPVAGMLSSINSIRRLTL